MLSKNLSNSPAARIALLRLGRNHHALASCHPMKKGFRTFKEHRKTSTSSAKFCLAVSNPKKNCWGKGTKTETKIWHTVTYYHTDNVSTLITVLNTRPDRISSRYFTQRFTKMLVRSSGRSPSSPNLFFTRTNSNSFCSCQKATSNENSTHKNFLIQHFPLMF